MNKKVNWDDAINIFDFAYQPIISLENKKIIGMEALLRNFEKAGFKTIDEVFNKAYEEGKSFYLCSQLKNKAIQKFRLIKFSENMKLFYNVDSRIFKNENFEFYDFINQNNIDIDNFVLEISEKYCFKGNMCVYNKINYLKKQGVSLAIDDYGVGYSNMEKLCFLNLDIIKIDRLFISSITKNEKILNTMKYFISIAKSMGTLILAEGVETEEEFLTCKNLQFDLAQGYYISRPQIDIKNFNY